MLPRIILVGLVGALGLSVPSRPETIGFMKALHSWMAGQFAALDGCGRSEDDLIQPTAVAFADSGRIENPSEPRGSVPDRVPVSAPENANLNPPVPAFTPIAVEERISGLAHELNQRSEGLGIRELPVTPRRLPVVRAARMEEAMPSQRLARAFLELGTIEEILASRPEEAVGTTERDDRPILSRTRRARLAETGLKCTLGATTATRLTPQIPPVVSMHPMVPILPVEQDSLALAVQLNRFGEAPDPARPVGRAGMKRTAGFTSIVPVASSDTGVAEELNRAAEGLVLAGVAVTRDERAGREAGVRGVTAACAPAAEESSELGDALRLTREAARAWLNVLKPTRVEADADEVQVSAR